MRNGPVAPAASRVDATGPTEYMTKRRFAGGCVLSRSTICDRYFGAAAHHGRADAATRPRFIVSSAFSHQNFITSYTKTPLEQTPAQVPLLQCMQLSKGTTPQAHRPERGGLGSGGRVLSGAPPQIKQGQVPVCCGSRGLHLWLQRPPTKRLNHDCGVKF